MTLVERYEKRKRIHGSASEAKLRKKNPVAQKLPEFNHGDEGDKGGYGQSLGTGESVMFSGEVGSLSCHFTLYSWDGNLTGVGGQGGDV